MWVCGPEASTTFDFELNGREWRRGEREGGKGRDHLSYFKIPKCPPLLEQDHYCQS